MRAKARRCVVVGGGLDVDGLRAAGLDVVSAATADEGLRAVAQAEPESLVVELELPGKDGRWLLRRLRDDFMGTRPRVYLLARPEAMLGDVPELGADAVILKPADAALLVSALRAPTVELDRARVAELITMSILPGELEASLRMAAKRVATAFRSADAILVAHVGEQTTTVWSRGPAPGREWGPGFWERVQAAVDARVPTIFANDTTNTLLGIPLEAPDGSQLGYMAVLDDATRLLGADAQMQLRALAARFHGELAWRTVHERIAADRDRLRESSMLDPMLAGVWTRAALDQTLPAEVSACHRRGEQMSLAVLDVRGMRQINERFGHVIGDAALAHVAAVTRGALRTQDLVARYAGDALVVVLGGTPPADARGVIERIQDRLAAQPLSHEGRPVPLGVVAGIAGLLGQDDTGEAGLERAAAAMRGAKRRRESILVVDTAVGDDLYGVSLPPTEGLEPGTTLGGMYKILHEINRGAMGVVYRAEDLGLGRPVALKTLRPDLARDAGFVERFRAEAALLASLHHENLVQVYAFGADGDDVYFVMELVEGEPLEDRIELARHEGRHMRFEEVSQVVSQIADALDAMHRRGVLHRDVKPANILFDRVRDRAVLVDVGIAKRHGTSKDPAGTPGYTAPESLIGEAEGPESDVYGLASTAYTLLCAQTPFHGPSIDDIVRRQISGHPQRASTVRGAIPAAADLVLARSLDPDPKRRHPSATAFAIALAEALRDARDDAHGPPTTSELERPTLVSGPEPVTAVLAAAPDTEVSPPVPARPALPQIREPEVPAARAPHTRGVLFRSSYRVLGAREGAAWVAQVARRNPDLGKALQPQNTLLSWHPTELYVAMLQAIERSGRDALVFARELGRVAASATFSRFFGADPAALSPGNVLETADLFWRRYHTWGKVGVGRSGERCVRIEIAGGPKDACVCASTAGIFEEVVRLAGAKNGEAAHPACEATGAEACAFDVSWT